MRVLRSAVVGLLLASAAHAAPDGPDPDRARVPAPGAVTSEHGTRGIDREQLRSLSAHVLPETSRQAMRQMLPKNLEARLRAANRRSAAAWRALNTRDDWERFRDEKLRCLREAIGPFPEPPGDLHLHKNATLRGDGYRVENLVFRSRPGLWVTANLYSPAKPSDSMAAILICHSHHTPKEHGELQDMGRTWARRGCLVMVPDLLGHGERRQHPFATAAVAPRPLRLDETVDGLNRQLPAPVTQKIFEPAMRRYREAGAADRLLVHDAEMSAARWLLEQLRGR